MFGSLVRWLAGTAPHTRTRHSARFMPRLESLDDRSVPGGFDGDIDALRAGTGSKPGGAGDGITLTAVVGADLRGGADDGVNLLGSNLDQLNRRGLADRRRPRNRLEQPARHLG